MSTLLMGAFFLASTSMFVSCKDYDDDINANTKAIQNVESALKEQKSALEAAIQQAKTEATEANSKLSDAIKTAQAAVDAAQDASLAKAIADANSSHATKSELGALETVVSTKASQDQLNAAIADLKSTLTTAISSGDATTAANAQAALTAAIDKVNAALDGVKGDIATVTNAQTEIKNTLTAAIAAVDAKVDQKASQAAVDALTTALAELKQSAATKDAVQNAIDVTKGEIAANIQAVQAAADKAQADATSAKADLATLAEKVNTAVAAQAAAETKIEALQKALDAANELEKTLQSGIATNSADIKVITNQIATLDAQIKSVNENLSTLIKANTNTIQDLAGTVGNIDLQVKALEKFCGNLEALNVTGIRDSMRLSFVELAAAKQAAAENLAAAEVRAALTAAGFVAALEEQLNERIDIVKDSIGGDVEAAEAAAKAYAKNYVDALNVPALQETVDALTADLGDKSIADILENLDWVNNTLTWTEDGKVINLEQELKNLKGDIADIADWQADIDDFVEGVNNNVAGYQTSADVQKLIDKALQDKDGKDKYVALAELNTLLAKADMAEVYKAAGMALTSDLNAYAKSTDLDAYLKKADIAIDGLAVSPENAKAIAEKAIEDAALATQQQLADAIKEYDANLAASLEKLFAAVKPVKTEDANADDETAEEKTAAQVIEEIAAAYAAEGGVSPAVVDKINVLRVQFSQTLTSIVFYPEYYYGGIESIEITALKIDNIYGMKDTEKNGTAQEVFEEIGQTSRQYDMFPNGYAKYHVNPVNANLEDYTLSFFNHTAITRSENAVDLKPIEHESAADFWNANTELLEVEFENSAELFNKINKISSVPSMAHNVEAGSHYVYGLGTDYGKGIVTALVAENPDEESEASKYVTSDYAMLVPVTVNNLVIANTKNFGHNDEETSDLTVDPELNEDGETYTCMAANKFHLYRKVKERIADMKTVNKLMYNEDFDLKTLVETHFVNNALEGADQKVDDDLFRRLNLDYRFYPIDYTTDDLDGEGNSHKTSETKFITLTGKDENGDFNGIGYFNQVKENAQTNGEKVVDAEGNPVRANKASLGRQPIVRVELYRKDRPAEILAIGYLKLEISNDIEKDAEMFTITTNRDKLLAVCDLEAEREFDREGNLIVDPETDQDAIILTWDQIQTQLNPLIGGEGLSPKEWNTYSVADGQFIYDAEADQLVDISEIEYSLSTPYYTLGKLVKVEDASAAGTHTDVLAWAFDGCDYKALFFDLMRRNTGINKTTGEVTEAIKRYFKLTSSDSANPDLYVGIEIAPNSIRFPAGTVGKVKGAYWKDPASNKDDQENPTDMVLNVDLKWSTTAKKADPSRDVLDGKYYKVLMKNFFGENILVDLNLDGLTAEQKELAEEKWGDVDDASAPINAYANTPIYFRMPKADDANEKLVYTGSEWQVEGISGIKYTLQVTDYAWNGIYETTTTTGEGGDDDQPSTVTTLKNKIWYKYGSSVSVTKINGKKLVDPEDEANDEFYEALAVELGYDADDENFEDIVEAVKGAVQKVQDGKNGFVYAIRVMTLDVDPASEDFTRIDLLEHATTSITDEDADNAYELNAGSDVTAAVDMDEEDAVPNESNIVKGITQDMLNYAKHDWDKDKKSQKVTRPYNMQLTAFLTLMADNNQVFIMPDGCDNFYEAPTTKPEDNEADVRCFILPGVNQGTSDCAYCPADEIDGNVDDTYSDCFRPFVNNKDFTVRFYRPVDIETGKGKEVKDIDLDNKHQITINFTDVLSFGDWAGYTPGANFLNFISYYDIKVALPAIFGEAAEAGEVVDEDGNTFNEPNAEPQITFDGDVTSFGGATTNTPEQNVAAANTYIAAESTVKTEPATPTVDNPGITKVPVRDDYVTADVPTKPTAPVAYDNATNLYVTKGTDTDAADYYQTIIGSGDNALAGQFESWSAIEDEDGDAIYTQTTAPSADAQDYNTQLAAYQNYLSDKAKHDKFFGTGEGSWSEYAAAKAEYDAQVAAYNEAYANYQMNKDAADAWIKYNADVASYNAYQAAQAYVSAYNGGGSYTPTNDGVSYTYDGTAYVTESGTAITPFAKAHAAWAAERALYDKYYAAAVAANASELDYDMKKVIYTDLGESYSVRKTARTTKADIEKLPTVFQAAPDDLIITISKGTDFAQNETTGALSGNFVMTYLNNNTNTNYPFHIYVPVEVSYSYLNNKPGAKQIVYAVITILSSKANENEGQ